MDTLAETPLSLQELRKEKGLTAAELGRRLGEKTGKGTYTHARVLQIEAAGTNSLSILEALAAIYDKPLDKIIQAAKRRPRVV